MRVQPCLSSATPRCWGLHYTELLGRLSLSQADVTQRLQYLACRLSMG